VEAIVEFRPVNAISNSGEKHRWATTDGKVPGGAPVATAAAARTPGAKQRNRRWANGGSAIGVPVATGERATRCRPAETATTGVSVMSRGPVKNAGAQVGKRVVFDRETWSALDLMARDRMMTFQELADEAFRDLLKKHNRPTDLRTALKQSARQIAANQNAKPSPPRGRK
jgi:hypothetical protein